MIQILILVAFWLSYLAITFASVITIADFVQRMVEHTRENRQSSPAGEQDSVKLHISEGLIQVNRMPEEQEKKEE